MSKDIPRILYDELVKKYGDGSPEQSFIKREGPKILQTELKLLPGVPAVVYEGHGEGESVVWVYPRAKTAEEWGKFEPPFPLFGIAKEDGYRPYYTGCSNSRIDLGNSVLIDALVRARELFLEV